MGNVAFELLYTTYSSLPVSLINHIEDKLLIKLMHKFGYHRAVQIADLSTLITSVLFTLLLVAFFLPFLLRNNHSYDYRFSDQLNGFVYMWAERNGIKEVIIKRPKNYRDRLEVFIALIWIRYFDHIPLRESRAKFISALILIMFVLMLIWMFISVMFAINVIDHKDFQTI